MGRCYAFDCAQRYWSKGESRRKFTEGTAGRGGFLMRLPELASNGNAVANIFHSMRGTPLVNRNMVTVVHSGAQNLPKRAWGGQAAIWTTLSPFNRPSLMRWLVPADKRVMGHFPNMGKHIDLVVVPIVDARKLLHLGN